MLLVEQLLTTKLFIPPTRPDLVSRPRLVERLNAGLQRKLTLISAPAGFGKTTLVTEWLDNVRLDAKRKNRIENNIAWLSLDEDDNDLMRFLTYFIAALNKVEGTKIAIGERTLTMLQSPQPPPIEAALTPLINEITTIPDRVILILDDYHLINAQSIHDALGFTLENMPPQMHLVIATREDPFLPLSRLRARDQMTELRAIDLRFTSTESAEFLNQVMGLNLLAEEITTLEKRTEGWIAGLQLVAISLQGNEDTWRLIESFSGSHRLVLDYLIEEVLDQQTGSVQNFLLQTAILDRLTGSLCDAITGQENGQQTLEMLDRANLFIVPLDNERRWYRYHHLFGDLLRQRLQQGVSLSTSDGGNSISRLHIRASEWYEKNGLEIEAFQHAVAANDIERAERLMEGGGMPLQFRGAMTPVTNWLASLPTAVLDARPSLWVTYASALTMVGRPISSVEEKLQAAEAAIAETATAKAALQGTELDDETHDLVGRIASIRAMLAIPQCRAETILAQSRRALEFLHPDNLPDRTTTTWTLGYAYQLQGNRAAAIQAYREAIDISKASGNVMITIAATTGLGQVYESNNQLNLAAESYRHCLQLAGDPPMPAASASYLGLAQVLYQWNELDAAKQHGEQSAQLAQQIATVDIPASSWAFLARLKLAQGDVVEANALLKKAEQFMQQRNFLDRMPEIATVQVQTLVRQGNLAAAAQLAKRYQLPISQARVHLAQGDPSAALAVLEPFREQVDANNLDDERLNVMVLQAVALHVNGEKEAAVSLLGETLALAEPVGFIRMFVDEGPPMGRLLLEALQRDVSPDYVRRILAAFPADEPVKTGTLKRQDTDSEWIEPLSERELDVLQLIAEGLTNQEIASRLYLSLNTIKAHTRTIYSKLGVSNRMMAVVRAKALGILKSK